MAGLEAVADPDAPHPARAGLEPSERQLAGYSPGPVGRMRNEGVFVVIMGWAPGNVWDGEHTVDGRIRRIKRNVPRPGSPEQRLPSGSSQASVGVPHNRLGQLAAHGKAPPDEPIIGPHRVRGDPVVPEEGAVDEPGIACAGLEERLKDVGLGLLAVIQPVSVFDRPVSWVPNGVRPNSGPPEPRSHPWTRIR